MLGFLLSVAISALIFREQATSFDILGLFQGHLRLGMTGEGQPVGYFVVTEV